ncbi:MAG TPA: leucine-rich repeat protein, partial [Paludibacter sp.]
MRKRKLILLLFCLFLFINGSAQVSKTVHVTTPGTLSTLLTPTELNSITNLTLTGDIDARDFQTMNIKIPALASLNIEDVHIVSSEGLQGTGIALGLENAIPSGAFYDKKFLKSILLPKSATSIEEMCFFNTSLSNINIPNSINKIGENAFYYCKKLKSLFIDDATVEIQGGAFSQCELLSDIHLGNNVISIGGNAFNLCTLLTSFTVPNSVKMLGESVFWGCNGLKEIDIQAQINTLPNSIFNYCKNLTDIKILSPLDTIQPYAFGDCWSLKNIILPNSLKVIKSNALVNCKAITELNIPNSVNTIGDGAFGGCISLKKITLPDAVSKLESYTFNNCSALDTIIVNSYKPFTTIPRYPMNESKIFESINKSKCVLHVPYKARKFYQAANDWKDFNNIIEKEYGVIPDTLNLNILPDEGANGEINLVSNSSWTVRSDSPWLVVSPLSGTNNGKVSFVASANDSIGTRIANIVLTD